MSSVISEINSKYFSISKLFWENAHLTLKFSSAKAEICFIWRSNNCINYGEKGSYFCSHFILILRLLYQYTFMNPLYLTRNLNSKILSSKKKKKKKNSDKNHIN
uniref:Uncharacterized protein n=1 Tax=Cacopsylla melanoneura TaxID=428564 RepID=A0A8D9F019_9HEMI